MLRAALLSKSAKRVWKSPYPPVAPVVTPIADLVSESWASFAAAGRTAVLDEHGNARTYEGLLDDVARTAGALRERGIEKGDRVAIVSPNHVDYACAALASLRLGAVVTPANPLYTSAELKQQLCGSGAKAVIAHPSTVAALGTAIASGETAVHAVACLDGGGAAAAPAEVGGVRCEPFDALRTASGARLEATVAGVAASDLALMPYSSGTTGLPKGTMLTHANLGANLHQFMPPEGRFIAEGAAVICPLPMYHIYAFTVALLFMMWRGHPLITMGRFDIEAFCALVQAHRPTRAYLVPPIILGLSKAPVVDRYSFESLQMITSAAAPLDAALERACAERLGCGVKQAWGMSELSPLGTWPADDMLGAERVSGGSVGPPVPSTRIKIVRVEEEAEAEAPAGPAAPAAAAEAGGGGAGGAEAEEADFALATLGEGEEGELLVSGPQVMAGYLNMPDASSACLLEDADGTRWLRTGDIARVDARGFVTIVDRAKELIKYKGFQVAPAELEALLYEHPHVADAAVIPVPHEEAGEVPRAYVVLHDSAEGAGPEPSEAELELFVAAKVAPHKRLRGGVVYTDKIPKSAAGKILRRLVRDEDRRRAKAHIHH